MLLSDGVTLYAIEFTMMTSDSDNTSDWHCISISKSNILATNEFGIIVMDALSK